MLRARSIFTAMSPALGLALGLILAGGPALAQGTPDSAPEPAPNVSSDAETAQAIQSCFACHGAGGVSRIPTRPTIAGQRADYVARQLTAFKRAAVEGVRDDDQDGDNVAGAAKDAMGRSDPIMAHMAEGFDDAQINRIAQAVSRLSCDGRTEKDRAANPPAMPPAMPQAAARCSGCHGADGIARIAYAPNLAGQQRAYLRRQLLLIRETAWGAAPRENESWRSHPIMERQAARISIEDVDALAQYYSALDCRGAQ